MAIIGTHAMFNTSEPEAVREIFRDVFGFDNVDAGGGWLIFAMPPCDLGVHPTEGAPSHEFSFECDDIETTMAELAEKGMAPD